MPDATSNQVQELVENQHEDQFHYDEVTGIKTPIRQWLAGEVDRLEGARNEAVAAAEAAVELERQKAEAELEAMRERVAELEKAAADKVLTAKERAAKKPAAVVAKETGDVK